MDALTRPTPGALALLREVEEALRRLVEQGEGTAIDLRGLPLLPEDLEALREMLGQGAVRASVDAGGLSEIAEARFPGVWWVTHHNQEGEIVAELVEVATVPRIVCSPEEDIRHGLQQLGEFIAGMSVDKKS